MSMRHPNIRGTADGRSDIFRYGIVTESVATVVFDENIDPAGLPEFTIPDGDYELLSEEDLQNLFNIEENNFYE